MIGELGWPSVQAAGRWVQAALRSAAVLASHSPEPRSSALGLFDTPLMQTLPSEVQEALGASVPFPSRLGAPDEYAEAVVSIARNSVLNGETIRLDGALRLAPR
jgi:3-hydroxyacyl-CoA dehydrogenase / 3-hydroxy-2-methylbutyryl-CoA dehydrogenase